MAEKQVPSELEVIIKEQNVAADNAKQLIAAFGAPFVEAGEILRTYTEIKVTDESQVDDMQRAREARLTLKRIRTGVESKRKELKEDALKAGRAIDGVARYIKQNIEPAEQYLELQEKFVENKKAKEAAELRAKRVEKIASYGADPAAYNLDAMSDGMFEAIVEQLETAKAQREAAEKAAAEEAKRVEAERVAKQKEMEAENARLRKEAAAKQIAEQREREKRENEERKAEAERQAEYQRIAKIKVNLLTYAHNIKTVEDADKQAKAMEVYADSLAPADREHETVSAAYHKSKAEIVELKQFIIDRERKAEADAKAAEEAKAKAAAEEAERAALLAPDKDKLTQFATALEIVRTTKLPAVQSNAAQQIVNTINAQLADMASDIKDQAAKL